MLSVGCAMQPIIRASSFRATFNGKMTSDAVIVVGRSAATTSSG